MRWDVGNVVLTANRKIWYIDVNLLLLDIRREVINESEDSCCWLNTPSTRSHSFNIRGLHHRGYRENRQGGTEGGGGGI